MARSARLSILRGPEADKTFVNPLISLSSGILGIEVQQADTPLVLIGRDLAWSLHPIPKEPEQLSGQKPASCKDGPFGTRKQGGKGK